MNTVLKAWVNAARACAALALAVSGAAAHAQVSCELGGFAPMALDVDFGIHDTSYNNNDATSATGFTFSCMNSSPDARNVKFCVGLGPDPGNGASASRRLIHTTASTVALRYRIYTDAARTKLFDELSQGDASVGKFVGTIAPNTASTITTTIYLYGRMVGGQTNIRVGVYASTFTSGHVQIRYEDYPVGGSEPSCSPTLGQAIPYTDSFTVQVFVPSWCEIDSVNPIEFPAQTSLNANVDTISTVTIRCARGTVYTITLDDGQNAQGDGQRRMRLDTTLHTIQYELYRNATRTMRWGSAPGESVQNTAGNIAPRQHRIYARIPGPQAVAAAGEYKDTVVVTIFH